MGIAYIKFFHTRSWYIWEYLCFSFSAYDPNHLKCSVAKKGGTHLLSCPRLAQLCFHDKEKKLLAIVLCWLSVLNAFPSFSLWGHKKLLVIRPINKYESKYKRAWIQTIILLRHLMLFEWTYSVFLFNVEQINLLLFLQKLSKNLQFSINFRETKSYVICFNPLYIRS